MPHFSPMEGACKLRLFIWSVFECHDLCNYHKLEINTCVCLLSCLSTDSLFQTQWISSNHQGLNRCSFPYYTDRAAFATDLCTGKQIIQERSSMSFYHPWVPEPARNVLLCRESANKGNMPQAVCRQWFSTCEPLPLCKPLWPKLFTSLFITVAKLQFVR